MPIYHQHKEPRFRLVSLLIHYSKKDIYPSLDLVSVDSEEGIYILMETGSLTF